MTIDERIRAELRHHAPEVDEQMAWARIESAAPVRRRNRAMRLGAVSVAALGMVVLGFILVPLFSGLDPSSDPQSPFPDTESDGSTSTTVAEVDDDGIVGVENEEPFAPYYRKMHRSVDREVSFLAPLLWTSWSGGGTNHQLAPRVWFWELYRRQDPYNDRIEFTDPVAYDAWCASHGGTPLLTGPASAAEIAQKLIADPNFETTEPVATRIGGLEALSIDVALAPGGRACQIGMIEITRWVHAIAWREEGLRLRLYLVDLPAGMKVQTMAITVVAPDERLEEVIAETAPIIESIRFHPRRWQHQNG